MKDCLPPMMMKKRPARVLSVQASGHQLLPADAARFMFFFLAAIFFSLLSFAQQDANYLKVITERSAKIINTLGVQDSTHYNQALQTVVLQYAAINEIHEEAKAATQQAKANSTDTAALRVQLQAIELKKKNLLAAKHQSYLQQLHAVLTPAQVEQVKDGMTYKVFPNTYAAYLDMIQQLTAVQKAKIYDWLKEAREEAMDAESSDKKHAVFGKYKGRINNYLSAEGYDLKKETEAWQQRLKAKAK